MGEINLLTSPLHDCHWRVGLDGYDRIIAKRSLHRIWIASKIVIESGPRPRPCAVRSNVPLLSPNFGRGLSTYECHYRCLQYVHVQADLYDWHVVESLQSTLNAQQQCQDPTEIQIFSSRRQPKLPLPLHLGILFAPPRPVSRGVVGNDVPRYTDAIFDK